MRNNIIIFGYGTGISRALAYRFGREGYSVGLVARNAEKLKQAILELNTHNIEAYAFSSDLSDIENIPELIKKIKNQFGEIKNIHWNAFHEIEGNLLEANPLDLTKSFHIRVSSYIATVQACLNDLKRNQESILSTNGIFALDLVGVDLVAKEYSSLAIAASAQYKTTNLLAHTLADSDVYVSQVIVNGFVDGTPGSEDKAYTVHPETIAEQFWSLQQHKKETSVLCGKTIKVA
ncbi:SDR family NAD(P)-dependent oxidoreductase [Acinetobacter baumannii]|uniref:SDR family NAD(P)-dependent oxidoreductase n=1 Tax=Acinetobacter baumannii TaxID=470 RepID=UPI003FA4B1AD